MKTQRRSPIKDAPLRNPGQSLDEKRTDLAIDLLFPAVVAIYLTMFWLYDLWRAYRNAPPMPWLTGTFAALGLVYAFWKFRRGIPELRSLRQALEGERSVGQGLEQLRSSGYSVYHDIVAGDFNVDHVLVGPAGVFTIETKTWSKSRERATIVVDGKSALVNGRPPLEDFVSQARAQADWIGNLLKRSTGRDFPVFPVVVFPGWWIEYKAKPRDFWLLNDKMLPGFLAKEPNRLSSEQTSMACFHLEAFVRSAKFDTH